MAQFNFCFLSLLLQSLIPFHLRGAHLALEWLRWAFLAPIDDFFGSVITPRASFLRCGLSQEAFFFSQAGFPAYPNDEGAPLPLAFFFQIFACS